MDVDFREVEISTYRNGAQEPVRVADASERDLRFWADKGRDPLKKSAAARELEYRASLGRRGGARAASPRSNSQRQQRDAQPAENQIQRAGSEDIARMCGVIENAAEVSKRFADLSKLGHLVTPSPVVARIPEGCALTVSAVFVDVGRETYAQKNQKNQFGLHRPALERISIAAAVNWKSAKSRRLDSGSDPWYCRMQVTGEVRNYDLSWREFFDHKELDLRDNAPIPDGIFRREKAKQEEAERRGERYEGDLGISEIAEKRRHIQSLCLTEARLRAIRSGLALRHSYTREELAKPFFVVAVAFTGQSSDPVARREFRQMIGRAFLGDSALLYGPAAVPQLPPVEDAIGHAPPPVERPYEARGEDLPDDDDWQPPFEDGEY